MMYAAWGAIAIVALSLSLAWAWWCWCQSRYEVVTIDGRDYRVRNADHAAVLHRLSQKMDRLVAAAKEKYPLITRFTGDLREIELRNAEHSLEVAYTIAKGEHIAICVEGQSELTLFYVAMHELAHVACDEFGHGPTFWNTFADLIKIAIAIGVYEYQDFGTNPRTFCGYRIADSPYVCPSCGDAQD